MYSPFVTFVIYHAALFSDNDMEGFVKDDLTPELIDAAVAFVEAAARSEKNMTKELTPMNVAPLWLWRVYDRYLSIHGWRMT